VKDNLPLILLAFTAIIFLASGELNTEKRERDDRALIQQLVANQKLTADILTIERATRK
jgi:hypothetical protein